MEVDHVFFVESPLIRAISSLGIVGKIQQKKFQLLINHFYKQNVSNKFILCIIPLFCVHY